MSQGHPVFRTFVAGRVALSLSALALSAATLSAATLAEDGQAPSAPDGAGRPRPNVLFFAVDDLNDWTGKLGGHPDAKTPHLDRLAERGVLFERAYCAAPACNPSRTAALCGLRPSTSGVYVNADPWRKALPDAVTIPQHFVAHGYEVAGGGKIFHGGMNDSASWQEYFPQPADPQPPGRPLNGLPRTAHFDWGAVDVPDAAMGDAKVAEWAIEFLRRKRERPFFLAVGFYRPHLPWYVPPSYFREFPAEEVTLPVVKEDDLDDVPPPGRRMARPEGDHKRVLESDNWRKAVSAYLASIRFADAMVGRVLEALDASPHAKDTIVVLWGDHGWHLGEKLHWRKFTLWEEATRMPLLVVAPGVSRRGAVSPRTVSLLDVYPTLIELCGLRPRPELDGRSLVPLLEDPEALWDRPALTTHGFQNHAVRSERWRYIRYADGSEELYDHEKDPMEWRNLASDPDLAKVKEDLRRWLPAVNRDEVRREPASESSKRKSARR